MLLEGSQVRSAALIRFHVLHVAVFPALVVVVCGVHCGGGAGLDAGYGEGRSMSDDANTAAGSSAERRPAVGCRGGSLGGATAGRGFSPTCWYHAVAALVVLIVAWSCPFSSAPLRESIPT
jgi:hypothetical protein